MKDSFNFIQVLERMGAIYETTENSEYLIVTCFGNTGTMKFYFNKKNGQFIKAE